MLPVAERTREFDFYAFAAPETIAPITDRVRALLATGRRMTLVRRYLKNEGSMEVKTGLRLDTSDAQGGLRSWSGPGHTDAGLDVHLTPGIISFGVGARAGEVANEEQAASRWHDKNVAPINLSLVHVSGFGQGRDDRIVITTYNTYGVGIETTVAFDTPSRREVIEEQAQLLEDMARVNGHWDAPELNDAAQTLRSGSQTLSEYLQQLMRPLPSA